MSGGAEYFGGKVWQKRDNFDLRAVSEKWLVSWRSNISGVVNTAFDMSSREKLRDKRVFFQKKLVWHSFLILNEELPDLWQKFSTMVSKTKSMWPEEKFNETFFGRRYNLIFCDGFPEETLICKKTAGSSVRHSSGPVEHPKGQISGRNKTFLTFGLWARMF